MLGGEISIHKGRFPGSDPQADGYTRCSLSSKNGKAPHKKLTVAEQIAMIRSLSQAPAALLVDVQPRTLRETPAAPRGANGLYDGPALVRYFRERDLARQSNGRIVSGGGGEDRLMVEGSDSPALERYRDERARMARMDRLDREGGLIPRAEVRTILARQAALFRRFGEKLEVQFGKPAADLYQEFMIDMIREILPFLGSDEVPDVPEPLPANGARDTADVVNGVKAHDAKT